MSDILRTAGNSILTIHSETAKQPGGNTSGNAVYFSALTGIHLKGVFRNFSIKYVVKGREYYRLNGVEQQVKEGMYLLAGQHPEGELYFDSKETVQGLCIDIDESIVLEAVNLFGYSGTFDLEPGAGKASAAFFAGRARFLNRSSISKDIQLILSAIARGVAGGFPYSNDFYVNLAEKIVMEETGLGNSLRNIEAIKDSTKKEILKRLLAGKRFIDDNFISNPPISEVARIAALSEFHFYRSFRQAFGLSPNAYLTNKRLDYSKDLIAGKQLKLSAIALICGYSDVFSFSRAFKRKFGQAPSLANL